MRGPKLSEGDAGMIVDMRHAGCGPRSHQRLTEFLRRRGFDAQTVRRGTTLHVRVRTTDADALAHTVNAFCMRYQRNVIRFLPVKDQYPSGAFLASDVEAKP